MKRIIALLLAFTMLLTGCAQSMHSDSASSSTETNNSKESASEETKAKQETFEQDTMEDGIEVTEIEYKNIVPEFGSLDDPSLLRYVEDNLYTELVEEFNSSDYFVENVVATYLSEEYVEELEYNSLKNIYFGYTLDELDEAFQGTRYVFTLGDNNETIVDTLEEYDDTYQRVIKDVAIGSGVILICVTVTVSTAGAGAPAVSMIFAAGAKTGATMSLTSGMFSGVATAIITGIQTHDMEQAMKAGLLAGSESFKWGAITGVIAGGAKVAIELKGATLSGLTMNEAARLQRETKWPLDAIKSIHSTAEAEIYKKSNLIPTQLSDGSWALLRQIDWSYADPYGRTNVQRVAAGLAPLDTSGLSYELHHIGMKADSPLAILTNAEHHSSGNFSILHYLDEGKDITEAAWAAQKKEFWNGVLKMAQGVQK